jgi:hypothetical protein
MLGALKKSAFHCRNAPDCLIAFETSYCRFKRLAITSELLGVNKNIEATITTAPHVSKVPAFLVTPTAFILTRLKTTKTTPIRSKSKYQNPTITTSLYSFLCGIMAR